LTKLKQQQQKILLRELKEIPVAPLPSVVVTPATKDMGKPPSSSNKVNPTNLVLIGDRSISHTPPFLLTYEIFNKNIHSCLIDLGTSSNIMPRTMCTKLNITPQKSFVHIVQLDKTELEVLREMISVSIELSSNPKVSQVIDILVVDIPEFYGLIFSKDWSKILHRCFATNFSHM